MANSVDGRDTVENSGVENTRAADTTMAAGETRASAGWYPDPRDDSMQMYWTGDSWSADVPPRPASPPLSPPVAEEVWPIPIDPPKSLLPAVIDTLDATDNAKNSLGADQWYSRRRFMIPLVLLASLAVIGFLTWTTTQGPTSASPVATTIEATTTTQAPTTTIRATTTTQTATTTIQATTTVTQAATTTIQATTTTQITAAPISPEEQFVSWVALMTENFASGPLPEDDRSLTESNAAFLCARAGGDETYDSLENFVRQFFKDAAPQYWSQQPAEVLNSYSTAYVNTSLNVYCPSAYDELIQQ